MSHDTHKPNRDEENRSVIFQPLRFRSFTVKNRLFRSSISGQFDNYDGSGAPARFNWEERFAIGGVGTIISSFTPVSKRARILTRYAMIDNDDMIPFWAEVGRRVHQHDCRFLMQAEPFGPAAGRGRRGEPLQAGAQLHRPERLFPRHPLPAHDPQGDP